MKNKCRTSNNYTIARVEPVNHYFHKKQSNCLKIYPRAYLAMPNNMVTIRNLENVKITGFKISFKTLWCLEKMGYFQEFAFSPVI